MSSFSKTNSYQTTQTSLNLNDTDDPSTFVDVKIKVSSKVKLKRQFKTSFFNFLKQVMIPKEYSSSSRYDDIGLVELEEEVKFQDNIKPICLQTEDDQNGQGTNFTVIGFGAQDSTRSRTLQVKFSFSNIINFSKKVRMAS